MPTDKEIEAAVRAYYNLGLAYDEEDYDAQLGIVQRLYLKRIKPALEAAEKCRAEATSKREEKLREALEKIFKLIYKCEYFDSVQAECGIIAQQTLQTEEKPDA